MNPDKQSLREIHRQLRSGAIRSVQLIEHCIQNYERTESLLNAYKTWNGDAAREQAGAVDTLFKHGLDSGPLMGLPISIKDLYGVPGMPVFAGSKERLSSAWESPGPVAQAVLGQLGVVTGKTHTVEFAFGGVGVNAHWGTPVNPWNVDQARVPGGSSAGAGVSLGQGSALLALGTDTAGSVRVPASVTGTVGLKTTFGRWSNQGIVPLSSSLDTPGILTRSVEDAIFAFEAIDPSQTNTPQNVRIPESLAGKVFAVPDNFFWDDADASIVEQVENAIRTIESLGGQVVRTTLPNCNEVYGLFTQGGLAAPELSAFLAKEMPEKIAALDPVVRLRVEGAEAISSVEYVRRRMVLDQAALQACQFFERFDVVLTPTVAISPPKASDVQTSESYKRANMLMLRNTSIGNLLRLSALTMPVGKDANGMPVGLQLMGAQFAEAKLLAMGRVIEQKLGVPRELLGAPSVHA